MTEPIAGRWHGTVLVALGQLVGWGTLYYTYPVLAPAIASAVGISAGAVAVAFSGTLLIAGALARPVGRTLDRIGPRPVLFVGALVGPLALIVLASAESLVPLILAFVLLGVAQALVLYEPAFHAVVAWFQAERAQRSALLLVTSVGGLASTVFVPVTVALEAAHGWRLALTILAGVLVALSVPIAFAIPRLRHLSVPELASPDLPTEPAKNRSLPGIQSLAIAFGVQTFAAMALTVSLLGHLLALGSDGMRAALIFGLVGAAQVPGRWIIAPLQGLIADDRRLPTSMMLQAVALAVLAVGRGPIVVGAALLFGALAGAMTMERAVVTVRRYGAVQFGDASGRIAAASLMGRAIAPIAVELTRGAIGYGATLGAVALVLAAAGLGLRAAMLSVPRPDSPTGGSAPHGGEVVRVGAAAPLTPPAVWTPRA